MPPRLFFVQVHRLPLHVFQSVVNLALVDFKDAELPFERILSACHTLNLRLERSQRAAVAEDVAIPLCQSPRVRAECASLALLQE